MVCSYRELHQLGSLVEMRAVVTPNSGLQRVVAEISRAATIALARSAQHES